MSTPNTDGKKSADRGAGGKFVKGNRASPGRPPGRGVVAELRERLAQDVDQIIDLLRTQALAGDPQAIRILLDRVLPSLRPVELPTPLDMPAGTLADQAQAVVKATADGDIAPSQAAQIITALGGVAKIIETTELLARIEKLEAKNEKAE
ncbi:hypothetical protein [Hydrogenophaga sp.]|uniref:hypothetical protein n=1 Tax=Hydrogenophaga sp. TaxID=1904254 RepID=UPI00272F50D6|nr:hypothetical protein [Hydrogenophaga sp.]MDP1684986.1 hypothetical protein [Hydrogenophaga sp.]